MNKIKSRREALGLTQEQLAERAGISRKTVYKAELNNRHFNTKTLSKLAKALGVEAKDLI